MQKVPTYYLVLNIGYTLSLEEGTDEVFVAPDNFEVMENAVT